MRGGERGFEHEPQGTVICVSFLPPFKVIGVGDVFRRSESSAEERVNVLGLIKGLGWGGEEEEEEERGGGGSRPAVGPGGSLGTSHGTLSTEHQPAEDLNGR